MECPLIRGFTVYIFVEVGYYQNLLIHLQVHLSNNLNLETFNPLVGLVLLISQPWSYKESFYYILSGENACIQIHLGENLLI